MRLALAKQNVGRLCIQQSGGMFMWPVLAARLFFLASILIVCIIRVYTFDFFQLNKHGMSTLKVMCSKLQMMIDISTCYLYLSLLEF